MAAQSERSHDHDHHGHSHVPADFGRAFCIGIILNLLFVVVEAGYGFFSNSMALTADAGHNLSDVLGLAIAWGASVLAKKRPTAKYTYGLKSSSILAALFNAAFLLVATGAILWESVDRLRHPAQVGGWAVVGVAAVGIVVNSVTAYLFVAGNKTDLNVRGAYLHMAADAAVALGVVVAGFVIIRTGWLWLDPAASILISLVIIGGTWGLLKDSVNLALNAVPNGVNAADVEKFLLSLPGVIGVHDLHIWGMGTTENALTVHLVIPRGHPGDEFLVKIALELKEHHSVQHPTIQIELANSKTECEFKSNEVV